MGNNVYVCDKLYLSNHWTEFNLAVLIFFRFVLRMMRQKKNLDLFAFLGLFGPCSQFSFSFFFFNLFVFQIFNDIKNFIYIMHLQSDVKTFNFTTFWIQSCWYEVKIWHFWVVFDIFEFLVSMCVTSCIFPTTGQNSI